MNLRAFVDANLRRAMAAIGLPQDTDPHISRSHQRAESHQRIESHQRDQSRQRADQSHKESADYQANGLMRAARDADTDARQLARRTCAALDGDWLAAASPSGPGFVNIRLSDDWLAHRCTAMAADARLGVAAAANPLRLVLDYSSPNLAKAMHVGHLRSTIIGDAMARVLEFLGHSVLRQNHLGDWGTQFGMLMAELERRGDGAPGSLDDMEQFYRDARAHFDSDPQFAERSRQAVVALQSGDARCRKLWRRIIDGSTAHTDHIYSRLNVSLRREHIMPESAYNAMLPKVVAELDAAGLLRRDGGAQVVFLPELAGRDGSPGAVIVQKADGGYLYATTDLAALRHRRRKLRADRLLYFVDTRQARHLQQIFAIGRRAAWLDDSTQAMHCAFGMMLDKSGRPFKTRSGDTVKLADLLDEAEQRAAALVQERSPQLDAATRREVARKIAMGAIKYADLCKTRTQDYRFSWQQMLALDGNTAPYLQYAHTRVCSIFAKSGERLADFRAPIIAEPGPARALMLNLLRMQEVLEQVADNACPHELCAWLFELAGTFMQFYEQCPILKAAGPLRASRLALAALSARTIKQGLELLGIEVMTAM